MSGRSADASPNRLLLDEMFSPRIASALRQHGIDCVCVVEDRHLAAHDDETVLIAALTQQRVLVTNNVADFETLRRRRIEAGSPVPGLIYTDDAAFPRGRAWIGALASALTVAATQRLVDRHGGVLWLTTGQPRPR